MKKKLVVLSGAGMSAESGISTFRDAGGLWEGHDVTEVASPEGFEANPELVLDFYNQRRKNVRESEPNAAHRFLAALEQHFDVSIVTQNVDDLHERGGSSQIVHLHGELLKAESTGAPDLVYELGDKDIFMGDTCDYGHQLRPHIVWFGEPVPKMDEAITEVRGADIILIIGTSLQVYPAAGLMNYAPPHALRILVDPKGDQMHLPNDVAVISKTAVQAIDSLKELLSLTQS